MARRVTGAEYDRLECGYAQLQYVMLCGPCIHPPFTGLRGIEKALGTSLCTLSVAHHLSVFVLLLTGDPYSMDTERMLSWLDGRDKVDRLPASRA